MVTKLGATLGIDAVATGRDVPHEVAVVVIGGGIVGVSAALTLARRGVSVALCEKGISPASNPSQLGLGAQGRS